MSADSFEIRLYKSCGLRYPIAGNKSQSERCPVCKGQTRKIKGQKIQGENRRVLHDKSIPGMKDEEKGLYSTSTQDQVVINCVLLDNIRSAWNVGSIFRTADGLGYTHVYLCGITPTLENEAVVKTSLGAEEFVTWSYHRDAVKLIKGLKKEFWTVLALEDDERAIPLISGVAPTREGNAYTKTRKSVLILGNELSGVDPDLLKLSDTIFRIPMIGGKKSFNVAVAFGIAAFALGCSYPPDNLSIFSRISSSINWISSLSRKAFWRDVLKACFCGS